MTYNIFDYSYIPSKTFTHKTDINKITKYSQKRYLSFQWLHDLKRPRAFDRRRPKKRYFEIHTYGSNSPPHPGKVKFPTPWMISDQIPDSPAKGNVQMTDKSHYTLSDFWAGLVTFSQEQTNLTVCSRGES